MFRLGKNFFVEGPPPAHNSKKTVMATRRAVCLLRSRRRTFLFSSDLIFIFDTVGNSKKYVRVEDCEVYVGF